MLKACAYKPFPLPLSLPLVVLVYELPGSPLVAIQSAIHGSTLQLMPKKDTRLVVRVNRSQHEELKSLVREYNELVRGRGTIGVTSMSQLIREAIRLTMDTIKDQIKEKIENV